ncbi:MFS transporter [Allostella sp. ATCC 35155]|nr:MFS transporter [Stella sp. ATCC 35155]
MAFARLIRGEPAPLGFGFLHAFASSVGQTYFISLFVPSISAEIGASPGEFATMYAVATIASACSLPWLGAWIDRIDLLRYGAACGLLLVAACLWTALSADMVTVTIGLLALRLAGQGLMSHVAMTATARWFDRQRGSALSLVSLGYPLGEVVYPALVVALIGWIGWRPTYALAAVASLLLLTGAAALVRARPAFRAPPARRRQGDGGSEAGERLWSRRFVMLLPLILCAPLLTTALIFHQGLVAADMGLTLEWFALSFAAIAIAQVPASLLVGPAVDRFGSSWLLVAHLAPLGLAFALLGVTDAAWVVPVHFALAGVASGMAAPLRTTILAELVGPRRLGAARGQMTALTVLATALGPALFGWMFEAGIGVDQVLFASVGLMAACAGLAAAGEIAARRLSRDRTGSTG